MALREAVDTAELRERASSIHEAAPIQRIVRDLDALAQHAVLHPRPNVELYGRVLCGLEPHSVAI